MEPARWPCRNELLDEVQRQVHEGSAPSLHSHPQYAQQTCTASCSLSAAGSSKQYLISCACTLAPDAATCDSDSAGISRLPRAQALHSGAGTYFGHSVAYGSPVRGIQLSIISGLMRSVFGRLFLLVLQSTLRLSATS